MTEFNPYDSWYRYEDTTEGMLELYEQDKPIITGCDTETTGLHPVKDKPFLIVFGWAIPNSAIGRVFTFEPTDKNMRLMFDLAKRSKMFAFFNAPYDLNMLQNIGWEYTHDNVIEVKVMARLSLEALSPRAGGDVLALTSLGSKYVHSLAAQSEHLVKAELRKLNTGRISHLTSALKQFDHPTKTQHKPFRLDTGNPTTGKWARENPDQVEWRKIPKKWTKKDVDDFLKDKINEVSELPKEIQEVWNTWQEEYPEPNYSHIKRDLMMKYAGEDVITMIELLKRTIKIVTERDQWDVVKRECKLIPIIKDKIREGFRVDRGYLLESKDRLKGEIIRLRERLCELAGQEVSSGQHPTLINIFKRNWNIILDSCNKPALRKIEHPQEAKEMAQILIRLRRLEKWYSTYIIRILERSEYDGRLYMSLDQAGAVSGRFTSDGQQFPNDPILDEQGNELFHPRRSFIADEGYNMYFVDFSQIELRSQANYTLLTSGGDLNLCRAYMPFKCYGEVRGIKGEYNYKDPKKRKYWELKNFWKDENGNYWEPTDVHGQTTHHALTLIGYKCVEMYKHYVYEGDGDGYFGNEIEEKEFARIRNVGKTFNFMKNYGTGLANAAETLDISLDVAQALIDGYEEAFPEVITFQNKVEEQHWRQGYVTNMYGRRYYLKDLSKSYVLNNLLVQGTCADLLKDSIIKVDEYLKNINCKTRMIMNIHDEVIFKAPPEEEHIVRKCREIMMSHDWHLVPIVADIERTSTSWADKEEI